MFFCTKSIFLAKRSIVAYSIPYIFWKLLFQRLIWHIWGLATCILWPVRFFVTLWFATGSISWNIVLPKFSMKPWNFGKSEEDSFLTIKAKVVTLLQLSFYFVQIGKWKKRRQLWIASNNFGAITVLPEIHLARVRKRKMNKYPFFLFILTQFHVYLWSSNRRAFP